MNLSTIEHIELVFENCEVFSIDACHILQLDFEQVKTKYTLHKFPSERYKEVESAKILLAKEANKINSLYFDTTKEPFKRILLYSDLVYIKVYNQNGKMEKVCMPWGDEYSDSNDYQQTILTEEGDCLIYIQKK